ncbi:hypothetical protein FOYG_17136 [Fusarium oxysporum NRRL 32931]|uniref:Zinc/iron permease n=1 Tax=Fusarium oxysporum NRRL 32931 TaxID=660029 RepID=W9HBX6_FUSOX|nr:hypothetical protein FOYG_17136 [Fusarium oxysporum NRRL 32931]
MTIKVFSLVEEWLFGLLLKDSLMRSLPSLATEYHAFLTLTACKSAESDMDATTGTAADPAVPSDNPPEPGSFIVTIDCSAGNEYDGRLGLRISAIFVILVGSLLGCLIPIVLTRSPNLRVPMLAFFVIKYFGSGVIIATAFIHLLAPAVAALYSPCLRPDSPITWYAWPEGICLMTVFAMFLAELLVSRSAMFGAGSAGMHGATSHDPAIDLIKESSQKQDPEAFVGSAIAGEACHPGTVLTIHSIDSN